MLGVTIFLKVNMPVPYQDVERFIFTALYNFVLGFKIMLTIVNSVSLDIVFYFNFYFSLILLIINGFITLIININNIYVIFFTETSIWSVRFSRLKCQDSKTHVIFAKQLIFIITFLNQQMLRMCNQICTI